MRGIAHGRRDYRESAARGFDRAIIGLILAAGWMAAGALFYFPRAKAAGLAVGSLCRPVVVARDVYASTTWPGRKRLKLARMSLDARESLSLMAMRRTASERAIDQRGPTVISDREPTITRAAAVTAVVVASITNTPSAIGSRSMFAAGRSRDNLSRARVSAETSECERIERDSLRNQSDSNT